MASLFHIRRLIYLTLLFCIFSGYTSHAQSSLFRNYTVKDGLPSSEVYDVMQDSKGYMWFATDHGVARFDGYTFKNFTTADGLADNTIFECIEDYKGRIWFRSFSGRLSYYYNDSIYRLPINDTLVKILNNAPIASLAVDTSDMLYISALGYNSGLIRINLRKNDSFLRPLFQKSTAYVISPKAYLLIKNNSYTNDSNNNSILYKYHMGINASTGIPYHLKWQWNNEYGTWRHDRAICISADTIAFSNYSTFTVLTNKESLFSYTFTKGILNITRDNKGGVWIILQNDAPVYYTNNKIITYSVLNFLKDKQISSVTIDREGGLWFTSLTYGIYYLNSLNFKTFNKENGLPGNKINFVEPGPYNTIWLSPENTTILSTIYPNDSIVSHYLPISLTGSTATIMLFHIIFQNNHTLWIGTSHTVNVYSNITELHLIAKSTEAGSYHMIKNNDETIWSNAGNDFYLLKRQNNSIALKKVISIKTKVLCFCKDTNNTLWAGTLNGLWAYSNDSLIYYGNKYPLLKHRVNDIKQDDYGNLWVATKDTGILIKCNNRLLHLTTKDGLLSNFCQCVYIDYKHTIWIGSNEGLSRIAFSYNPSGSIRIDSIKNITNPGVIEVNCITGIKNNIYVATNNGLTSFDADKIKPNSTPPPVYITRVTINNSPLYNLTSSPRLSYDKNYVVITYVGLTYKNADNTTYRYKMKGIDTGWVYTKNRDVQYPKLPPGNYSFMVSARNNDGVWSTTPASFSFIITPPFWQTWWARSLVALLIIGFIYWRIKVIEKREKRKTETNKQLATMELRELKAQIDPHFLFNNFNTLTHLTETKSDDAPEFVSELSKFYRYSLQFRNREFIELENEIKQAERYIHLLKIRFGNSLKVHWQVDNKYMHYFIATYSLQLLFENITKHNTVSRTKPLWVTITSTHHDTLIVKNQLQPKNSASTSNGIGLKSINQRYLLLTSKKINIIKTSEYFSVELPLIKPSDYESINY